MFIENPTQQIMVIAHNKSVLTYIHDAIFERDIATVGYYVGGMKEAALKKTEEKQVVIATYAMAAEALDIKTLCTLIMVTPKTDIEQSVGRILRSDHEMPVVVDIVDSHDPFIKQWNKRKTFYRKENYKIIKTASSVYEPIDDNGNMPGWELVYEPKTVKVAASASASEDVDDYDDCDNKSDTNIKNPNSKCVIDLSLFSEKTIDE
jgi:superfamily II DNA or RNA helicase